MGRQTDLFLFTYIIILSMLLYISGRDLVCLEYPSKHDRLYQDVDYSVYLQYCIDFHCITVVLRVSVFECFLYLSLDAEEILL